MFKGVIPLLTRNLRAPWSTSVHCTDALPIGYAVSQTHVSTEVISKVARVHDRCFFSQSQEVSLRQRALTAYQQFREHDPDVPSELFETSDVVLVPLPTFTPSSRPPRGVFSQIVLGRNMVVSGPSLHLG